MAGPTEPPALERLPDEILLKIVQHLETARDMSSLAGASKKLQRCVDSSSAWQDFVRSKFTFTSIPPKSGNRNWKDLSESLTYQSRCWDRRSIRCTGMFPAQPGQGRGLPFQPVIDADYDLDSRREIVAWGAGEDIVARYRQRGGTQAQPNATTTFLKLTGGRYGLRAGVDDVKTMDIVNLPHLKGPAILVGRENGDLSLLSAQPNHLFGQQLANFDPCHASGLIQDGAGGEQPAQTRIMSVDILNDNNQGLVAACTNLGVSTYHLPQDSNTTAIPPVEVYDVPANTTQQVYNAKWMGGRDLLALAFRGLNEPLKYLSITPWGWTVEAAAKNARVAMLFDLKAGSMLTNSLQPVRRYPGMTGPTPLLLSSWRDGTVRLQDIRTPSPFDVVYQDNVQPACELGSLMTYGADRFIGGDMLGAMFKIFDFRWPKTYYHTSGLTCGSEYPFRAVEQRFIKPPIDKTLGRACCDHLRGLRCRWHELSREVYYRPNALFMLSQSVPDYLRSRGSVHVTSLAKSSDISPNFYVGIPGGVIEANLGPINTADFDKHLGFPDFAAYWPHTGAYVSLPMPVTMMEVGDGLRVVGNTNNIVMPMVHTRLRTETSLSAVDPMLRKRHRLDESFQKLSDFGEGPEEVVVEEVVPLVDDSHVT
ncbi:hypothetical protein BR93DRAFT_884875 [Coniochaeta sp. PMI_546]|nr:hypothetical protein BR93DRAFT_884875 [Coniochaeta sp. PMI_546]